MKRGFTIAELLVVIVVLGVLATLSVVVMNGYQKQADDASAKSLASIVRSGVEKYHDKNNEYPTGQQVHGGYPASCGVPSSYQTAANLLDIPLNTLSNSRTKLVPYHSGLPCNVTDRSKVYYVTRAAGDTLNRNHYPGGGSECTYSFPASGAAAEAGSTAFMIFFWSDEAGKWQVAKSVSGTVNTSDETNCKFTAL